MKIILIGAVGSSLQTLQKLIEHQLNVVLVLGQEEDKSKIISGYSDLSQLCKKNEISFQHFRKINDSDTIASLALHNPDIIFAVGFSQLLSQRILDLPKLGCIGFHPTYLPKGRGRAPLAWLILKERIGAATFFLMGKGADDGPIFVQKPFLVEKEDNARSVAKKIRKSIDLALDEWLPKLKSGEWNPIQQNDSEASYYGRRGPLDGWINWTESNEEIHRLVLASSDPHPGAFTFYNHNKVLIWKTSIETNYQIQGVTGRVLLEKEEKLLLQCGSGLLWVEDYEILDVEGNRKNDVFPIVGSKFGYNVEYELFKLINIIKEKSV